MALYLCGTLPVCSTGSNTHRNGHPGGDGQTGDDGEGLSGKCLRQLLLVLCPEMSDAFCVNLHWTFDQ